MADGNPSLLAQFAAGILDSRNKETRNLDQAARASKAAYDNPDARKKSDRHPRMVQRAFGNW